MAAERAGVGVGVIGLGTIGSGVARHLVAAGHRVVVCDTRAEAVAPFGNDVVVAATPAKLAAAAGPSATVVVAVVDDEQVRSVVAGPDGLLAGAGAGASVLVLSTVSPGTVVQLATEATARGVAVLDCGVSGGPAAAAQGQLVCMVGGDAAAVDRVRPVLDAFSSAIIHMGPTGTGMAAKLARNVVQYGAWLAAYEGQQLAEASGVPVDKLARAIQAAEALSGGSTLLMFRGTAAPFGDDADPGLVAAMRAGAALARKDLGASRALAAATGLDLPLTALAEERCDAVFGVAGPPGTSTASPGTTGSPGPTGGAGLTAPGPASSPRSTEPTGTGRAPAWSPAAPAAPAAGTGGADRAAAGTGHAERGNEPRPDRAAGMARMEEVYGFSVDPAQIPGPYVAYTVDHLFGDVWNRPGLDIGERRLVVMGVLAALGQFELMDIQFTNALDRGELTEDQVRELVLLLAHYVGWPLSKSVNDVAERVLARHRATRDAE